MGIPSGRLLRAAGVTATAGAYTAMRGLAFAGAAVYEGLRLVALAMYSHFLVPGVHALQAAAVRIAGGMSVVYDQMVKPLGTALAEAARAVASMIYAAACEGAALSGRTGVAIAAAMDSAVRATSTFFSQSQTDMRHACQVILSTSSGA